MDLVNFEGEIKTPVITAENAKNFHRLRIEVDGNNSFTYVDGILVDAVLAHLPRGGVRLAGRTLNPRGFNDVLTYPRLNEIGFFAGEGCQAHFKYLKVKIFVIFKIRGIFLNRFKIFLFKKRGYNPLNLLFKNSLPG